MVTAPARIVVSKRSGRVRVVAEGNRRLVTGAPFETDTDGTIRVGGATAGSADIRCPEGSDIVIGFMSGRVELVGHFGDVRISTVSGRISVESARTIDVRTVSGRVEIGAADEDVRVVVASGRVTIGRAGSVDVSVKSGRVQVDDTGDARVHALSGRVDVAAGHGSNVEVRTTCGRIAVTLPRGSTPRARLSARRGRVDNSVPLGEDGSVDVQTVSGRVSLAWR